MKIVSVSKYIMDLTIYVLYIKIGMLYVVELYRSLKKEGRKKVLSHSTVAFPVHFSMCKYPVIRDSGEFSSGVQ